MKAENITKRYVAFLRGINVGGHHKLPMAELRTEMAKMNFKNVETVLNSGNVLFDANAKELQTYEKAISECLKTVFGFPVPTILRESDMICGLLEKDPFKDVKFTKDIRLYVSFLRKEAKPNLQLSWTGDDDSFKIIGTYDEAILSVLDLAVTKTTKGMEALDRHYGSDITTRNWNTILKLGKKLEVNC